MKALGKLYLIPTTLGESDPMDVLPQTVKRAIDFIDYYIVENEKNGQKIYQIGSSREKTARFKNKFVE